MRLYGTMEETPEPPRYWSDLQERCVVRLFDGHITILTQDEFTEKFRAAHEALWRAGKCLAAVVVVILAVYWLADGLRVEAGRGSVAASGGQAKVAGR